MIAMRFDWPSVETGNHYLEVESRENRESHGNLQDLDWLRRKPSTGLWSMGMTSSWPMSTSWQTIKNSDVNCKIMSRRNWKVAISECMPEGIHCRWQTWSLAVRSSAPVPLTPLRIETTGTPSKTERTGIELCPNEFTILVQAPPSCRCLW